MSSNDAGNFQHGEQRRYFRIEDQVLLEYLVVDAQQYHTGSPEAFFPPSAGFKLIRELQAIDHESHHLLSHIADTQREVADYLKVLNQKLDFLARAFVDDQQLQQPVQPRSVSLSEGGLGFSSDTDFPVGTLLALKLTLLSSYVGLIMFGRVTASQAQTDSQEHRISVAFEALTEQDQTTIARHVIKTQAEQRRRQQGQHEP